MGKVDSFFFLYRFQLAIAAVNLTSLLDVLNEIQIKNKKLIKFNTLGNASSSFQLLRTPVSFRNFKFLNYESNLNINIPNNLLGQIK